MEMVEELAKPLFTIHQKTWLISETLAEWRLTNTMPICKRGGKKVHGNCRPVSLTLVLGKVLEQSLLNTTTQHIQDNEGIRNEQHRFVKGRCCLTHPISFYDKVTQLVDVGKAVDAVYLTLVKYLMLSSAIFSWRKRLFMAWTCAFFNEQKTGWMARPRKWIKSSWWLVTGGVPQRPVLFSIFNNYLDEEI